MSATEENNCSKLQIIKNKDMKITLEIPKEDIEEVIHLLRYAMCDEPVSNDVWTLLAPFCEKHSKIKFEGKEEELLTYSVKYSERK